MKKTIGIIGFGNMGSAIAGRIKDKYKLSAFDKDKNKIRDLSGIQIAQDLADLVSKVDSIILAIKPQDFDEVLNEIKDYTKDKLIISIAAGITTGYIEKILNRVKVVRTMPNLPAKIGMGMICLSKGKFAEIADLKFAEELFGTLGRTLTLGEEMMDAVTAVSGSGPGFFCDLISEKSLKEIKGYAERSFIPSLSITALNLGFSPAQARILSETTARGTIQYLIKENLTPDELKKRVASKGGTTEAGLEVLCHDIKNLGEAVRAAVKRAKELSRI